MLRRTANINHSHSSHPSRVSQSASPAMNHDRMPPPSRNAFKPLAASAPRAAFSRKTNYHPEVDPKRNYYHREEWNPVKQVKLSNGEMADVGSAAHIYDQVSYASDFVNRLNASNPTVNTIRPAEESGNSKIKP